MSRVHLHIPEFVQKDVEDFAKRGGVSPEQLMVIAIAEKMAALRTAALLEDPKVKKAKARFLALLKKAPGVPPLPGDELPPVLAVKHSHKRPPRKSSAS